MLFTYNSDKLRILFSILLTAVLSCSAFAEVYFLKNADSDYSELTILDEESKAESEKGEEKSERKSGENPFEFTGAGDSDLIDAEIQINAVLHTCPRLTDLFFKYSKEYASGSVKFYNPHYKRISVVLLYHQLIFYDHIS